MYIFNISLRQFTIQTTILKSSYYSVMATAPNAEGKGCWNERELSAAGQSLTALQIKKLDGFGISSIRARWGFVQFPWSFFKVRSKHVGWLAQGGLPWYWWWGRHLGTGRERGDLCHRWPLLWQNWPHVLFASRDLDRKELGAIWRLQAGFRSESSVVRFAKEEADPHLRRWHFWQLHSQVAATIHLTDIVFGKVSKSLGFETFAIFLKHRIQYWKNWYWNKYRIRYRKKIGIEKSIGFGIGNIWYRKKFWIRFRSDFWHRHTLLVTSRTQTPGVN